MKETEKKELICCLQVLLEKFVVEKNIRHLANVLKKHHAISKGQEKKVSAACKDQVYSVALQRLISSLEKGELSKFENALNDEEFPADAQARMMLSLLVGVQDKKLIFAIKNWEKLSQCEEELKHLVSDGSRDGDWVKCLVFAAFEEILQQKEEKPILDSISKVVLNAKVVECSTSGSEKVMPIKLKRSGPVSIAQPLQITEENFSDVKISPPPAKRSKILKLKRRQGDKTSKLESKKFKTEDAGQPESGSGDATLSKVAALEKDYKNEEKISPGEKHKQALSESDEHKAKEPQDSKNLGERQKTKRRKKKKARKPASDGNVDPKTSEESAQPNVDNKEDGEEGEDAHSKNQIVENSSSSAIEISSTDDSSSSESEDSSQDSTNPGQKGPTTRLRTAAKKKSQEGKDSGDNKGSGKNKDKAGETGIIPLDKEDTVCYKQKEERMMEIRAIVSDIKPLPTGTVLCIACEETKWLPKEMAFNERKGYFFLQFLHNSSGIFEFKFCYWNQYSKKVEWEKLPGYGRPHTNRVVDLRKVETSWTFVLNVCLFKKSDRWENDCCISMEQFLPNSVSVTGQGSDIGMETQTSPAIDLFCWVNCVTKGWQTNAWTNSFKTPKRSDFEEILMKWLDGLINSQSDGIAGKFVQIQIALTLSVAFATEKHNIMQPTFLVKLFQILNLNGMDAKSCEKLSANVKKVFEANSEFGLKLPTYLEAMEWLYVRIRTKPNFDWIFSLPLYWLLVHEEVKAEVLKPNAKRNFVYARSSLPSIDGFDWTSVWYCCQSVNNRLIEDLAPAILETAKLHPWIVGTFQYLLTYRELGKLILSRKESKIAMKFSIDSTLFRYFCGYAKKYYSDYAEEQHQSCKNYFSERLSECIEHASEPEITCEEKEKQVGVCVNLIGFVNQFLDLNLRLLHNADIDFCARVIAQKAVYWASLLDMKEELKDLDESLMKMLELIKKRIHIRSKVDVKEIEHWNGLLKIEWNLACLAKKWTEQIVNEIKCAIKNAWLNTRSKEIDGEKYLDFYAGEFSDMDLVPELAKCFDEIAFACTEKILKDTGIGKERSVFGRVASLVRSSVTRAFGGASTSSNNSRFITIFETLFMKSYEKFLSAGGLKVTIALNFLCNWSFSAHFYDLFGQELPESFSQETKDIIKNIEQDFMKVVKSLDGAEITVGHLNIVLQRKEQFLSVWGVLNPVKKETDSTATVDETKIPMNSKKIDLCETYLRIYKRTKSAIEDFIQVCNYVEYEEGEVIPHEELSSKVKCNVQKLKICELVTTGVHAEPNCCEFFGITEVQLVEFQQISFIKDSKKIFREMFVCSAKEMKTEQEEDDMVPWRELLQVFKAVKRQIFDLIEEIDSGILTMDAVIQRFRILDGKKEEIDCEITLFYDFFSQYRHLEKENDNENVESRMLDSEIRKKQIFNSFQLQKANEAVDVLLELRELLKLEGDFSILTQRKEMVENQTKVLLRTVPEKLEIPQICWVDAEKLNILNYFMEERTIIEWLKEKTNGMQEVKVMCDLAMISAGENVVEVDRVSNLLSAVIGFEPLLFWEKDDRKKAGSAELLKRCEKVWKNETKCLGLIEKWRETSQQLPWFKEVEQFYGSVEKSSLTRTQQINEGGVYTITSLRSSGPLTVENCISLTIPGKTSSDKPHELGLGELHELQSKLMLIAGEAEKGQQDVNAFVAVLTSVQQLAEVYAQLVTSGCMLFAGWEAVIMCHGGDELSIEIRFIDDAPSIVGNGKHTELDNLTEILKTSLVKWEEHVSSKRVEFYCLNEYNIQQIMYLCHKLANLEDLEEITSQVRSLLTFVRKDFDIDDLKECLENARKANNEMDVDTQVLGNQNEMRKKLKAVRTLLSQEDVSEKQAKAAVQAEGCNDLASLSYWILVNGLNEEDVEQYSLDFDSNCDLMQEEREVDYSIFESSSENSLKQVVSKLQDNTVDGSFLDSVNTICAGYLDETIAMNLQDHLSIGLLGRFLENLDKESRIHRDLCPGLRLGLPNLLICEEDEILLTVLSLYMQDDSQPLPNRSEVLICSDATTDEEMEMFLRRAMCQSRNGGCLIYTLAFADKLNYTASLGVENIFIKLTKSGKTNQNYQLVILLSKQQHYLTTCFDKYVVDGKWSQPTGKIRSYLKQHLQVDDSETMSAASVTEGNYMVKVVTASRSGVGKSLYIQRLMEELEQRVAVESCCVTIRLLESKLDVDYVIEKLSQTGCGIHNKNSLLVHVDLTPAVQHGIESFAFNLFVLGSIQGNDGRLWKIRRNHLYAVEMTDFGTTGEKRFSNRHILNLLPCVTCRAPREVLNPMLPATGEVLGMDTTEFRSETFQRPFQYLMRFEKKEDLDNFTYQEHQGAPEQCIEVLLRHCCIRNPSWAQLRHFCSFLNVQLKNCEKSLFCTSPHIKPFLAGLKVFAVKFMIRMAQDFATPSLKISDASVRDSQSTAQEDRRGFVGHQIRRKWEETSHPYVFFNEDGQTMTFINVRIDQNGFLLNQDGRAGAENIATPDLVAALKRQGFDLSKNFDEHPRAEKLRFLRQVLGIKKVFDPDPTYELTTDNVLKILAIYMRFRCQIPVIIMGETGCGKTRLVEFMSKLKAGDKIANNQLAGTSAAKRDEGENTADCGMKNMITLKIHGGITVKNIHQSVEDARNTERQNRINGDDFTVLFYDEANTTEAIYAIKEVMCDKSIDGRSFNNSKLQIVAACNPYKKLSAEAIKKLEDSGLGYRIRTSETTHLFGNIPVRSLVYRVVALPPSMQPFVWDFGQLGDEAEKIYIQQMTRKLGQKLGLSPGAMSLINNVLSSCQRFMRTRKDECRYVSLRDVERCMTAYEWFYKRRGVIYPLVAANVNKRYKELRSAPPEINDDVRTLIQTVGVCYHASLDNREPFRSRLAACLNLPGIDDICIEIELTSCQRAFLRNVRIGDNIACNEALRENVFLMAVCADMKIPLFLIGKPGSSKSLAKTIVTNNMQGQASHAPLYRQLKQIHILSYQCSALTDAEGIERVFSQCSQLQKKQNPDTYTAVVVLDEIGLAEDSPNMPLKVLHPLLERRSTDLNTVAHRDTEHVGFVGISNWALDPAKMNRGIFLTRNRPTEKDLKKTGKEIFQGNKGLWRNNVDLFEALTREYLKMYIGQEVEYFGLRDYYSLMKMICGRCTNSDADVKFSEVVYAILRNFSGGEKSVIKNFLEEVKVVLQIGEHDPTPSIPIQNMIEDNLRETNSRFLLLLANQFSVVTLLQSCIEDSTPGAQVVFGSSFPGDHSYTQICQNMSRIRASMETGKTVILLNMASIHESLYDALNQHFVTFGGQNYVDLGLGGHRVKCRIAEKFRLIVIEKKEVVNREYPIPLINRLEKHHFNSDSLLSKEQRAESNKLKKWALDFVRNNFSFTCHHAFVGFHDDTISSVVLTTEGALDEYKSVLLQCCSMDAILRLPESDLHRNEAKNLQDIYFNRQHHDALSDVLKIEISRENPISVLEISSFSGVLSKKDVDVLHTELKLPERSIVLLSLEQFHTQHEYSDRLDQFVQRCFRQSPLVLLIQCAQAQSHAPLIACARHLLMNRIREVKGQILETGSRMNAIVALLLSTEREGEKRTKTDALALQPTREAIIIHVDEMRPANDHIARANKFIGKSLRGVFEAGKQELETGRTLGSLINIRSLLVDCVCESVARVKGQTRDDDRYLKRVSILMNLCSREDDAGDNFRKVLLKKIIQVYAEMEEENDGLTDWVIEKANNRESLQEGGTFRKTLWLCLKEHMSHFLSHVVSVVDRCNNLDLIAKDPPVPWELKMWLGMFDQLEILWKNIRSVTEVYIPGSRTQNTCKLPFSFLLIDYLQAQWSALESHLSENLHQKSFIRLFHGFGMKGSVDAAPQGAKKDVMKCFISDLIGTLYRPGTDDVNETSVVENVVFVTSWKNITQARDEDFEDGDEIAIIFLTFKTLSKKLEKFSEVLQCCPRVLEKSSSWMTQQKTSEDFILHCLALRDGMNLLKTLAEKIHDPVTCVEWIDLARTFKKMFVSVTNIISEEEILKPLKSDWMGLSLVDLLLLQLLPPAHLDNTLFRNFVEVISPQVRIFWKASLTHDARSYNFLRLVLSVLKRCFTDINLKLLIDWKDVTCKMCTRRAHNPTFLPCHHFACANCISQHARSGGRCITCNAEIPEDFIPFPAKLDENGTSILKKMKSNCTSFFLEYLRQFCFRHIAGASSRTENQVKRILKELVVGSSDEEDRTQLDSTSLDLNINTKSSILQTLLRHNKTLVVDELNRWLEEADKDAKKSLITVLLKTFQQKNLANAAKIVENKEKLTKFWQDLLERAWRGILPMEDSPLDVENLQKISELRCAFMHFVSLVDEKMRGVEYSGDEKTQVEGFVNFSMGRLTSPNMPQAIRDYVLKSGCHKFGTQWLHQLAERDDFKVLIPTALRQATENCNIDHWALLGEGYTRSKSVLYQTEEENYRREMAAILKDTGTDMLPNLLAITSWCDKKGQAVKDLTAAILRQNGNNDFFVKFLVEKKDGLKYLLESNMAMSQQAEILYQLLIIVIAATTVQNDIMKGFYELIANPRLAHFSFLPTMPEDVYFATPVEYRLENKDKATMYSCPQGHLYSIGDCTQPAMETKCPTCKSTIGGKGYRPAAGNKKIIKSTQSQIGYKMAQHGENVSTGADRMTPQGAAATQFVLHSCLLAATLDHEGTVASVIHCPEVQQFLILQLQANLRDLSKALARNADDTVLVLHRILLHIIIQGPRTHAEDWSTLEARKTWEEKFRQEYLLPVFENLEGEITEAQRMMRQAEETGRAPLTRLIREIPNDDEVESAISWEQESLWNIIEHPTSAHLMQVLGDQMEKTGGEVLQVILQTPDLHFVKFLENILRLQQRLTERYQYQIDMKESDQNTLEDHIQDGGHQDENAIREYISAWNEVFKSLQAVAPDYLSRYLKPISLDSPLSMALPSTRGRGQCAKILAEYLIDIQNQFLSRCVEVIKPAQKLKEVEVHQMTTSDFVCIQKHKDLLALINMHTNYTITLDQDGRHHVISYNIEALEKQVREKFVMCKKSIRKNTIPCMKYLQDGGIGSDWKTVASTINQGPLTAKLTQEIDGKVEKYHSSDLCEGVRTLTNAISFLAMVKTNRSKSLCEFLEKDLQLSSSRTLVIPRSAQISHALAIYQRLTWHKSIKFTQQALDPYKEALVGIKQELIPEETVNATLEAFKHIDVAVLQQRMNEMMIAGTGIENPDWTLKEDVFPFIEFLEQTQDDSWYAMLPEELCNKHLRHLFQLSVEGRNEN